MTRTSVELPVLTCDDCGVCCESIGIPPFKLSELMSAQVFVKELVTKSIMRGATPGSPCVAYDSESKRCTIYDHRPSECRDFRVGGDACLAERLEAGII